MSENDHQRPLRACTEMEQAIVLYACDELSTEERKAIEGHTANCAGCAAALERSQRFQEAISSSEAPADALDRPGSLLAQCRSELEEALDDAATPTAYGPFRAWRELLSWPRNLGRAWVLHPASSAVLLILLGFGLGVGAPAVYRAVELRAPVKPAMVVEAAPRLTDQELQNVGAVGLRWESAPETGVSPDSSGATQAAAPRVELQIYSQRPIRIEGTADDIEVQRVLTYMVANSQRFDPGVLLDSLDLLRPRAGDPNVRRALCTAARQDRNPGVRLKALEALRGYEQDATVRQTMLDALGEDSNCGVRVEALNTLLAILESQGDSGMGTTDAEIIKALRQSMETDPNHYVRMVSAEALRQISSEPPN